MPNHHYATFVTLTYTTHIISLAAPTLSPLDLCTDPTGETELMIGGPHAGRSDSHLPSKGHGSGQPITTVLLPHQKNHHHCCLQPPLSSQPSSELVLQPKRGIQLKLKQLYLS